jgi:hypothetical protein
MNLPTSGGPAPSNGYFPPAAWRLSDVLDNKVVASNNGSSSSSDMTSQAAALPSKNGLFAQPKDTRPKKINIFDPSYDEGEDYEYFDPTQATSSKMNNFDSHSSNSSSSILSSLPLTQPSVPSSSSSSNPRASVYMHDKKPLPTPPSAAKAETNPSTHSVRASIHLKPLPTPPSKINHNITTSTNNNTNNNQNLNQVSSSSSSISPRNTNNNNSHNLSNPNNPSKNSQLSTVTELDLGDGQSWQIELVDLPQEALAIKSSPSGADDDDGEALLQLLMQQQLQPKSGQSRRKHYSFALKSTNVNEALIAEYNEDMRLLEEDMRALAELQREAAALVRQPAELLQQTETNVDNTTVQVEQAIMELAEASRLRIKARMKKYALVGGAAGAVLGAAVCGTVGGVFTTPAGGIALGAGGAAVLGAVGAGAGALVASAGNNSIDRHVIKVTHDRAWIGDEEAPQCMKCAQPFTTLRRRHHCRKCGGVFCGNCCYQKQKLRYQGVEKLKKMRVCVDCHARPGLDAASRRMDTPSGFASTESAADSDHLKVSPRNRASSLLSPSPSPSQSQSLNSSSSLSLSSFSMGREASQEDVRLVNPPLDDSSSSSSSLSSVSTKKWYPG